MVHYRWFSYCVCFFWFLFTPKTEARTAEEWTSRVIYQILTDRFSPDGQAPDRPCSSLRSYCGGTFAGIRQRLDYIQNLGANAIWISPIVENTPGGFHGYWAKNLYKINPYFGTEDELKELINTCHKRDIWVMVDVVANHMGYPYGCDWHPCSQTKLLNFTGFTPFNTEEHFHTLCDITHWRNQTEVEDCWLAHLPDLNQSVPYVRDTLLTWIQNLTNEYNIDGYRVDTVVEVRKDFWTEFQAAAGVYCLGEANNGDFTSYTAGYQGPLDAVLNFPLYWAFRRAFNEGKSMTEITNSLEQQRKLFSNVSVLGIFLDNHDFQRFLNLTDDTVLLQNALAYCMLAEGIPILYYGTEQGFHGGNDPNNRESLWPYYNTSTDLYTVVKTLANLRTRKTIDFSSRNQRELYVDSEALLFVRGENQEILALVSNVGKTSSLKHKDFRSLGNYRDGTVFQSVFKPNDVVKVSGCVLSLTIVKGLPAVYTVKENGTGVVCDGHNASSTGTNSLQSYTVCYIGTFIITLIWYFIE